MLSGIALTQGFEYRSTSMAVMVAIINGFSMPMLMHS
jgi:hypothetical protein